MFWLLPLFHTPALCATTGIAAISASPAVPPADPNAPVITGIADQTIDEDTRTDIIPFSISDADTALSRLIITRESGNLELVPLNGIVLGGVGADRTVRVTPAANRFGSAFITIKVNDGTHTTAETFEVG